jgi:DNA-binding Lrp family transcriptional regulator
VTLLIRLVEVSAVIRNARGNRVHDPVREWDYVLTVVPHDVDDYQRFVFDKLSKPPNVANYRSTLIMRVVKHTTELPI